MRAVGHRPATAVMETESLIWRSATRCAPAFGRKEVRVDYPVAALKGRSSTPEHEHRAFAATLQRRELTPEIDGAFHGQRTAQPPAVAGSIPDHNFPPLSS